jgi:Protein of unknown function (DUF3540)
MARSSPLRSMSSSKRSVAFERSVVPPSFSAIIDEVISPREVRVSRAPTQEGGPHESIVADVALIAGYTPSRGDRVVVLNDGASLVVIGVTAAERPLSLSSSDGARAEVGADGIDLYDRHGTLVVRYRNGAAEIEPHRGDLVLKAPAGRVRIEASDDVEIAAGKKLSLSGARGAEIKGGLADGDLASRIELDTDSAKVTSKGVEVRAGRARVTSSTADVVARLVRTSATTVETKARTIETTAEKIAHHAKDLALDVAGLLEQKAGRFRSIVRGAFSVRAKSTALRSQEDTSIDGKRVLLG